MTEQAKIEKWVVNNMIPGKWYPVKPGNIELLKKLDLPAHELTFSNDYTKVKLTLWNGNRPGMPGYTVKEFLVNNFPEYEAFLH